MQSIEDEFREKIIRYPDRPKVLLEGDSWITNPAVLSINQMARMSPRINSLSSARAGDEIVEMLAEPQRRWFCRRLDRYRFDAILMSGGGNDLVAAIDYVVKTSPESLEIEKMIAPQYLENKVLTCCLLLTEMYCIAQQHAPGVAFLTHEYDVPPVQNMGRPGWFGPFRVGPWVQKRLIQKGVMDPQVQWGLINFMMGRFRYHVRRHASLHPCWHHIETTGTLRPDEWGDEMHPTVNGYRKLYGVMENAILKAVGKTSAP